MNQYLFNSRAKIENEGKHGQFQISADSHVVNAVALKSN